MCGFSAGFMRGRAGSGWQYLVGYPHLVRDGCGSTAMAAGRVRGRNFSPHRALVPRGLLLVVSSTCRGDSSLLALSTYVYWSLALDFTGVEAARCIFVISEL